MLSACVNLYTSLMKKTRCIILSYFTGVAAADSVRASTQRRKIAATKAAAATAAAAAAAAHKSLRRPSLLLRDRVDDSAGGGGGGGGSGGGGGGGVGESASASASVLAAAALSLAGFDASSAPAWLTQRSLRHAPLITAAVAAANGTIGGGNDISETSSSCGVGWEWTSDAACLVSDTYVLLFRGIFFVFLFNTLCNLIILISCCVQ
jgi:hypothetical protein